jgi:hypothetical protein
MSVGFYVNGTVDLFWSELYFLKFRVGAYFFANGLLYCHFFIPRSQNKATVPHANGFCRANLCESARNTGGDLLQSGSISNLYWTVKIGRKQLIRDKRRKKILEGKFD